MYPRKEIASQAISCASRVAGAWEASIWSRRWRSATAPVTSRNAQFTLRSAHRVSQLLTGRGTISVPMMLAHAVSTSRPPATAATERPASGTTMGPPQTVGGYAEPTEARPAVGPRLLIEGGPAIAVVRQIGHWPARRARPAERAAAVRTGGADEKDGKAAGR